MEHSLNIVKRTQKFREASNLKHLYRNELVKACFAHDAAYFEIKDLAKRTISDKILKIRAYEIAINHKYDGHQRALAKMVYWFLDKKTGSGVGVNRKLTEELHTPAIKKFRRKKVYARFKDNILTEKFETNPRAPKFKVNDRVRITKYKNIFIKSYSKN